MSFILDMLKIYENAGSMILILAMLALIGWVSDEWRWKRGKNDYHKHQ